jgi:hypothetical protein
MSATVGRLGGGRALDVPVFRIVVALAICLAVAGLAVLLLRRRRGHDDLRRWMGAMTPARAVEVVEVRRIGMHADIGVVRHAGREYLLLVQSSGSRLLSDGPAPPAVDGQGA